MFQTRVRAAASKFFRTTPYINLLTSSKLNSHRAGVDRQTEEKFEMLVKQMSEAEGINEHLKATDQMAWVGKMNNLRSRAFEVVVADFIQK